MGIRSLCTTMAKLYTTWKDGCAKVHQNEENSDREFQENKLRALYNAYERLNHIDKDYLNLPIEIRLKHSTSRLKNWINEREKTIRTRVVRPTTKPRQQDTAACTSSFHPQTRTISRNSIPKEERRPQESSQTTTHRKKPTIDHPLETSHISNSKAK